MEADNMTVYILEQITFFNVPEIIDKDDYFKSVVCPIIENKFTKTNKTSVNVGEVITVQQYLQYMLPICQVKEVPYSTISDLFRLLKDLNFSVRIHRENLVTE